VAQVEEVPRQRTRRHVQAAGEPCACSANALCLCHYAELPPSQRARARRQAGVHELYVDAGGSRRVR
jgi:hypothetical protein